MPLPFFLYVLYFNLYYTFVCVTSLKHHLKHTHCPPVFLSLLIVQYICRRGTTRRAHNGRVFKIVQYKCRCEISAPRQFFLLFNTFVCGTSRHPTTLLCPYHFADTTKSQNQLFSVSKGQLNYATRQTGNQNLF